MIELNLNLVDVYYKNIIEYSWSSQTIKNKLAYFKRKGMFTEHLALHVANKKHQVNVAAGNIQ